MPCTDHGNNEEEGADADLQQQGPLEGPCLKEGRVLDAHECAPAPPPCARAEMSKFRGERGEVGLVELGKRRIPEHNSRREEGLVR